MLNREKLKNKATADNCLTLIRWCCEAWKLVNFQPKIHLLDTGWPSSYHRCKRHKINFSLRSCDLIPTRLNHWFLDAIRRLLVHSLLFFKCFRWRTNYDAFLALVIKIQERNPAIELRWLMHLPEMQNNSAVKASKFLPKRRWVIVEAHPKLREGLKVE